MQRKRPARVFVKTPAQWDAVTSPVRVELVESLRVAGASSVAELAAMLDRPADSLYHHVRKLVRAGIVAPVAVRRVGRQTEAVYDLECDRIEFDFDPATGRNADRWKRVARTLLRTTQRLFERALDAGGLRMTGPGKSLWSRVESARLTPDDLARLNAKLVEVEALLQGARSRNEGRLFNLTLFVFPVARARRADRSARAAHRTETLLELAP